MTRITLLFSLFVVLLSSSTVCAAENNYLYKVSLVQAAPGKLTDLIDLYKQRGTALSAAGDESPLWMRHSQGDHWDLMILTPMQSYASFYQPDRITSFFFKDPATTEKFKTN